jgi:hypothetical protein
MESLLFSLVSSTLRLGGADGRSHRAELGRLAARVLELGAGEGVDRLALRDLAVAEREQDPRVLSLQESSGDSAGPEVDALARVCGDLVADEDVGELESAAGTQDAVDLGEHRILVGDEVDDAVGDHHVDRFVLERE